MAIIDHNRGARRSHDRTQERELCRARHGVHRDHTYWPALPHAGSRAPGIEAIIDPMAEGIDLASFYDLLRAPDYQGAPRLAAGHSKFSTYRARSSRTRCSDNAIAAMVCGFGESVRTRRLRDVSPMRKSTNRRAFTDWSRRPADEAPTRICARRRHPSAGLSYEALAKQLETHGTYAAWLEERNCRPQGALALQA